MKEKEKEENKGGMILLTITYSLTPTQVSKVGVNLNIVLDILYYERR